MHAIYMRCGPCRIERRVKNLDSFFTSFWQINFFVVANNTCFVVATKEISEGGGSEEKPEEQYYPNLQDRIGRTYKERMLHSGESCILFIHVWDNLPPSTDTSTAYHNAYDKPCHVKCTVRIYRNENDLFYILEDPTKTEVEDNESQAKNNGCIWNGVITRKI